ncbi:SusE outer membrane protein [Flavobacterium glycines]|uniref:SusE outer membrane protein n=1 Tax=Flavobacterium glycines TaxID=551990 RepID=A0A1B9DPI6_9FLAO|nr:hypothetical protein [Flavobacterium glycines]OCB71594.1 hypothetical protein FBGL_10200 [Flavobacterium glycines]GEL10631.1 hypothetical protein FGL01_13700 [Flavobacterium glycines]SDI60609.1 SusE outer membrane protein [Flavobacterium glycines]
MKRLSIFILCCIIFSSCSSGGGGSDDPTPTNNTAPSVPILNYPTNNLVCINNAIKFEWGAATDAQNDAVTYQLEIATDNVFTQNLNSTVNSGLTKQISLEKGKLYYWRVKATDSKNASSSFSAINTFYTEGEGVVNHLPFAPSLVTPVLNSNQTKGTITLSWTAVDADAADVLKYDVYFGTANSPTEKVASDLTLKTFDVNASNAANYYWKVVVKDGKGGTTIGQVWNFKAN